MPRLLFVFGFDIQPYCMLAGGAWSEATNNGSFSRQSNLDRMLTSINIGGRGCFEPEHCLQFC